MAKKKIVWAERAKRELNETLVFYIERNGNPEYSFKIIDELEDRSETLSKRPFIGRLTSNKITRVIPMKTFLLFYEIKPKQIEILSFWDNRRDENKIEL